MPVLRLTPSFLCITLLFVAVDLSAARADDGFNPAALADEIERDYLFDELGRWYPEAMDEQRGGFHASFGRDWSRGRDNVRNLVYQARMTWTAATVARHYPDLRDEYLEYARHGVEHLRDHLWDEEHGGHFWERAIDGGRAPGRGDVKHAYAISFGIYALAAAHRADPDLGALDLAIEAFRWFDRHAHDSEHGGYYEHLERDGTPARQTPEHLPPHQRFDALGTLMGYKSMNSHIHILEAFTELHHAWSDERLRERLEEVFHIIRDRIYVEPGALNLYFTPDWRPLPDHNSVGHDVETAYLLVEAAEALGMADDERTWHVARRLVDHGLDFGWDNEHGGFYYETTTFGRVYNPDKHWWVQAEGLNALLLMHEHFGHETDRYRDAFLQLWRFIADHQYDGEHGGWFGQVSADGREVLSGAKGHQWKTPYHTVRAKIEVTERLRRLADHR